jgi:hypothetical protein
MAVFLTSSFKQFIENEIAMSYGIRFNLGWSDGSLYGEDVGEKNEFEEYSLAFPVIRFLYGFAFPADINNIEDNRTLGFIGGEIAPFFLTYRRSSPESILYQSDEKTYQNKPQFGFHSGLLTGFMMLPNFGIQIGLDLNFQPYSVDFSNNEQTKFSSEWLFLLKIDLIGRFGF